MISLKIFFAWITTDLFVNSAQRAWALHCGIHSLGDTLRSKKCACQFSLYTPVSMVHISLIIRKAVIEEISCEIVSK